MTGMFCTVCASVNARDAAACSACGAALVPERANGREAPRRARAAARRLLLTMPVVAALLVAAGLGIRLRDEQARAAAAYAAGDAAWNAGDFLGAIDAFSAAGAHLDAPARAEAAEAALSEDRLALDAGLGLIAQSDYAGAIDALLPVARRSPGLGSVTAQLAEARRLRIDELLENAASAEAGRDLPRAEQSLRAAVAVDPSDQRARERLSALRSERGPVLFTRERILMIAAPDGGDAADLLAGHEALFPTWSPDRASVAFLALEYADPETQVALYVLDVASGQVERLAGFVSAHAPPVWSPDSRYIGFTSLEDYEPITDAGPIAVRLADRVDGRSIDVTGSQFLLAFNPAFSPDGRTLYFVSKDRTTGEPPPLAAGDLFSVEIDRIERNPVFDNLTAGRIPDIWSAHPAPAGRAMLLFSLYSQQWYEPPRTAIRRFDPASGALSLVLEGPGSLGAPAWSPRGDRFAFADGDRSLIVVENGAEERIDVTRVMSKEITWSPDGRRLLASAMTGDEPSVLVDFSGDGWTATDVPLRYDSESPYFGPPQWAPFTPPIQPARIGTGLDTSE